MASDSLRALLTQHDELRVLMDDCEQLADDFDRGRVQSRELGYKVDALRLAFEAHNEHEERLLGPILGSLDGLSARQVEAMIADHLREHRLIERRLDGPTEELRATLYELRAHLVAEERSFLSATSRSGTETAHST